MEAGVNITVILLIVFICLHVHTSQVRGALQLRAPLWHMGDQVLAIVVDYDFNTYAQSAHTARTYSTQITENHQSTWNRACWESRLRWARRMCCSASTNLFPPPSSRVASSLPCCCSVGCSRRDVVGASLLEPTSRRSSGADERVLAHCAALLPPLLRHPPPRLTTPPHTSHHSSHPSFHHSRRLPRSHPTILKRRPSRLRRSTPNPPPAPRPLRP